MHPETLHFTMGARLILPANLHENTIGCCLIIDNL
jgi:hypothetical protein